MHPSDHHLAFLLRCNSFFLLNSTLPSMQNTQEATIEEEITLFFYLWTFSFIIIFLHLNSKFPQREERVTYLPSMFQ